MSIVITGNPGVGKHSIIQEIAQKLNLQIIDINLISKDYGLFEKNGDTNDVDVDKLKKILDEKINEKSLIVGHLAPYVLNKDQVEIVIVLRRSPYDLVSVYQNRGYSNEKTSENIESEILGVIAHDSLIKFQEKYIQVNVTDKSISKVVDKVLEMISKNTESEDVDWLELVEKNNDLGKFFVD